MQKETLLNKLFGRKGKADNSVSIYKTNGSMICKTDTNQAQPYLIPEAKQRKIPEVLKPQQHKHEIAMTDITVLEFLEC